MASEETMMYAIGELKTEVVNLRTDVKTEVSNMRTEFREEVAGLRRDLTEQGKDLAKIKGGIALAAVLAGMVGAGIAKVIGGS